MGQGADLSEGIPALGPCPARPARAGTLSSEGRPRPRPPTPPFPLLPPVSADTGLAWRVSHEKPERTRQRRLLQGPRAAWERAHTGGGGGGADQPERSPHAGPILRPAGPTLTAGQETPRGPLSQEEQSCQQNPPRRGALGGEPWGAGRGRCGRTLGEDVVRLVLHQHLHALDVRAPGLQAVLHALDLRAESRVRRSRALTEGPELAGRTRHRTGISPQAHFTRWQEASRQEQGKSTGLSSSKCEQDGFKLKSHKQEGT